MPTAALILLELERKGHEKTRAIYSRHGMPVNRVYGVSVADLKVIAKSIRRLSAGQIMQATTRSWVSSGPATSSAARPPSRIT